MNLPLRSGQWLVASGQRIGCQYPVARKTVSSFELPVKVPTSWRPSGHSSPVFRVGSGEGRVYEIEGGDVTKVGGG